MASYRGRVHLDLGAGDARGPYRWAVRDRDRLFIASDANASRLLDTAWKAARKPQRGGISNLICIGEPLEVLARELGRVADRVSIILPWGSLLHAVAAPDMARLRQIASLCLPCASLEVVLSYDPLRDAQQGARLGISDAGEQHFTSTLPYLYEQADLRIVRVSKISIGELAAYQTTWAKRLARGRFREIWRIKAIAAANRS